MPCEPAHRFVSWFQPCFAFSLQRLLASVRVFCNPAHVPVWCRRVSPSARCHCRTWLHTGSCGCSSATPDHVHSATAVVWPLLLHLSVAHTPTDTMLLPTTRSYCCQKSVVLLSRHRFHSAFQHIGGVIADAFFCTGQASLETAWQQMCAWCVVGVVFGCTGGRCVPCRLAAAVVSFSCVMVWSCVQACCACCIFTQQCRTPSTARTSAFVSEGPRHSQ